MKMAYIDCFSGISGDMLLSALLGCGVSLADIEAGVRALGITEVSIRTAEVRMKGIRATRLWVEDSEGVRFRNLAVIEGMLEDSDLPVNVKGKAIEAFRLLAAAEARVHGVPVSEVHFHEIGAVDTIVDIVGSLLACHLLGIHRVSSSPVPWSRGLVSLEHGMYPLPAPATAELLLGIPCYGCGAPFELVTPTGAVLLRVIADDFGVLPSMRPIAIGYGAGHLERPDVPNVLRLVVGEVCDGMDMLADTVDVVETEIDDMPPEFYSFLADKLAQTSVLDYFYTPVYMKKGRPGCLVTLICPAGCAGEAARLLLTHSSTLGVRYRSASRMVLARSTLSVSTRWGEVRVKVAHMGGREPKVAPEFEDCRRLASANGVPIDVVYREAVGAALVRLGLETG